MLIYSWRGKRWGKRTVAQEATYRTVLLPGFELPLKKLLDVTEKYQ